MSRIANDGRPFVVVILASVAAIYEFQECVRPSSLPSGLCAYLLTRYYNSRLTTKHTEAAFDILWTCVYRTVSCVGFSFFFFFFLLWLYDFVTRCCISDVQNKRVNTEDNINWKQLLFFIFKARFFACICCFRSERYFNKMLSTA